MQPWQNKVQNSKNISSLCNSYASLLLSSSNHQINQSNTPIYLFGYSCIVSPGHNSHSLFTVSGGLLVLTASGGRYSVLAPDLSTTLASVWQSDGVSGDEQRILFVLKHINFNYNQVLLHQWTWSLLYVIFTHLTLLSSVSSVRMRSVQSSGPKL